MADSRPSQATIAFRAGGHVWVFMMVQKQRISSSWYQIDAGHEAQAVTGSSLTACIEKRAGRYALTAAPPGVEVLLTLGNDFPFWLGNDAISPRLTEV